MSDFQASSHCYFILYCLYSLLQICLLCVSVFKKNKYRMLNDKEFVRIANRPSLTQGEVLRPRSRVRVLCRSPTPRSPQHLLVRRQRQQQQQRHHLQFSFSLTITETVAVHCRVCRMTGEQSITQLCADNRRQVE